MIPDPFFQSPYRRNAWNWVCEFCYRRTSARKLPRGWELVYQSAVCPACHERVRQDGGYAVVKGGAYAGRRRDPRRKT